MTWAVTLADWLALWGRGWRLWQPPALRMSDDWQTQQLRRREG